MYSGAVLVDGLLGGLAVRGQRERGRRLMLDAVVRVAAIPDRWIVQQIRHDPVLEDIVEGDALAGRLRYAVIDSGGRTFSLSTPPMRALPESLREIAAEQVRRLVVDPVERSLRPRRKLHVRLGAGSCRYRPGGRALPATRPGRRIPRPARYRSEGSSASGPCAETRAPAFRQIPGEPGRVELRLTWIISRSFEKR